ncbi:hypothetical protein ABBQ38_001445 [Trebouxia sp. C0009 RCD-2024]
MYYLLPVMAIVSCCWHSGNFVKVHACLGSCCRSDFPLGDFVAEISARQDLRWLVTRPQGHPGVAMPRNVSTNIITDLDEIHSIKEAFGTFAVRALHATCCGNFLIKCPFITWCGMSGMSTTDIHST